MALVKLGSVQSVTPVVSGYVNLATDCSTSILPVANGGSGSGSFTDGQLLIGNTTGNTLTKATLTGTTNQVVVTNGAGSITLSLPQSIATTSAPQFAGLGLNTSVNTTTRAMEIGKSFTDPAATSIVMNFSSGGNTITSNNSQTIVGVQGDVRVNPGGFTLSGGVRGVVASVYAATGSTGTAGQLACLFGQSGNLGSGTVTNAYFAFCQGALNSGGGGMGTFTAYHCDPQTAGTKIYGFRGQIASTSGRWNLYMDGTAGNHMAGELMLGTTTSGSAALTFGDAKDIAVGSTTGTKIATATTQKVGFYNATPIAQRSGASQAAVATTASTQTTPWGYSTQAQADAVITLLNELRAWAVAQGFIKGSA